MIYQLVNKKTKILAIAISQIAHSCNQYNHVFALLISMPCFNSINFDQNTPKIKSFFPKNYKIFERLGLCSQTPITAPPLQIFALVGTSPLIVNNEANFFLNSLIR